MIEKVRFLNIIEADGIDETSKQERTIGERGKRVMVTISFSKSVFSFVAIIQNYQCPAMSAVKCLANMLFYSKVYFSAIVLGFYS